MVLKWYHMIQNLQIYIRLVHLVLVILNSSPAIVESFTLGTCSRRYEECKESNDVCESEGGFTDGDGQNCVGGDGLCCDFFGCERGGNDDCPDYLACDGFKCVNSCLNFACDSDKVCRVVDNQAQCFDRECDGENEVCLTEEKCIEGGVATDTSCSDGNGVCCRRTPCKFDNECVLGFSCIKRTCTAPCKVPGTCGCQATCTVVLHSRTCNCPAGFPGDAFKACLPDFNAVGDVPYADCLSSEECVNKGGIVTGRCADGFGVCCSDCETDSQCPPNFECRESRCSDPCENPEACGLDAICTVWDRKAVCTCPTGYIGNPEEACEQCASDSDCPCDFACKNELCIDPCEMSPCGSNAECTVVDRQPNCNCPDDYTGDPREACFPEKCDPDRDDADGDCLTNVEECSDRGGVETGICASGFGVCCLIQECEEDEHCPSVLACIGSTCQDPCPGTCEDQALCRVVNHVPRCIDIGPRCKVDAECQSNLACPREGRENLVCIRIPCEVNGNCPSNLACNDSFCSDPCDIPETCGLQATCTVVNHQPNCECPPDFTGNPSEFCYPLKCGSASGLLGNCVSREACAKQYGIPHGTCASGFGVCCLDSKYCDNSNYANSLTCKKRRPNLYTQSASAEVVYKNSGKDRKKKKVKRKSRNL